MINEKDRMRLPVTIKMEDGRELDGDVIVNIGGALDRALNNETKFILFGDSDGTERMIAKSGILEVTAHRRARDGSVITQKGGQTAPTTVADPAPQPANPYATLGLDETASDEDIQNAFVARSGNYHPDRFRNAQLPQDVADFIESKSHEINTAYRELMKDKAPVLMASTG